MSEKFFESERALDSINRFLSKAAKKGITSSDGSKVAQCVFIVESIRKQPTLWSDRCSANIEWLGDQILGYLDGVDFDDPESVERVFVICYRLLSEFDLTVPRGFEINHEFQIVIGKMRTEAVKLSGERRQEIDWISTAMPVSVLKNLLHAKGLADIEKFNSNLENIDKIQERINDKNQSQIDESNRLSEKLSEYKNAFNFVGLYDGFSEITKRKKIDLTFNLAALVLMGFLVLAPFVYNQFKGGFFEESMQSSAWGIIAYVPTIGVTLILVYFFSGHIE